ncbi:hypothetical protein B296_00047220 [Ensete ventricosum]|uniref:Uncharacterized protein n=1 Tax=Ensete ventricosum TaxID=4639 RepID=A0A426XAG7_ENSVE|nr:hypothetical protein B296_00047220 [Ensete ventricosum]
MKHERCGRPIVVFPPYPSPWARELHLRVFSGFNQEKSSLLASMVVAPRLVAMPTQSLHGFVAKLFCRKFLWLRGTAKEIAAIKQLAFELYPCQDSLGVFKPIVPLNCISFEVDDSDVHHGSLRYSVIVEIEFGAREPSYGVSLFPSREVHPHA